MLIFFPISQTWAIERLPISVPKCYAHPGITQSLFEEKMRTLSPIILQYFKSVKTIFEVDTRRVEAMATGLQSKPFPTVVTKKDARFSIEGLRGGKVSTNCSGRLVTTTRCEVTLEEDMEITAKPNF